METYFVYAVFDLSCEWQGSPPVYRIYVNDEMFAERQWRWEKHFYLEEILQMQVPPGKYTVTVEPVDPYVAQFTVSNNRINHGPAWWKKRHRIIVQP